MISKHWQPEKGRFLSSNAQVSAYDNRQSPDIFWQILVFVPSNSILFDTFTYYTLSMGK